MTTLARRGLPVLSLLFLCGLGADAFAQAAAGVSDERVKLPQAPGALDGVGENASTEGNHGALGYNVKVEVPQGWPGLTPEISLSYSSMSGSDVVGVGWSLPTFSIERMTSKGLQKYDTTDRFVAEGSNELVNVGVSGQDATYRARFEGGFARYTWKARGTGDAGYWKVEFPDGRIGYYGADSSGVSVPTARVIVPTTTNTFRWHLVTLVDQWGHQMNLTWTKDSSGYPLLDRIDYLYDGGTARHSLRMVYESRSDIVSDARPGFELQLTQRVKEIRVLSGAEVIRSYVLTYETDANAGGATRLSKVQRFGRNNVAFPVTFNFGYSQTLGGACDTNCQKPFVKDMGTVGGVDFTTGKATLIDMNGDALPDVLYTDSTGHHSFYYAKLDSEGIVHFDTTPVQSAQTTSGSAFVLGDPKVQVIDVNGDGFVDITQAKVPAVLCNNGSGDWQPASYCTGSAPGLPSTYTPEDDTADPGQQDPKYVRFFDYDNDRRIDWLRTPTGGTTTEVLANTATGFQSVLVSNIGAVFDESPLQLADMNGDGLQDPVELLVSGSVVQLQYKLNLGWGNWSNWKTLTLTGLDPSQAASTDIEDINGDGLADVVAVTGNEVRLALNRNGDRFDAVKVIATADLGSGTIPNRGTGTTVTYADMNGNGSSDIVWIDPTGDIQYLELFPVRPNLISRIDNGIGAVQLITYGTSIVEQARDSAAQASWSYRVPNAYTVVRKIDSFVTLTGTDSGGLHEVTNFRYHSGFYDGTEKQFRGYETVDRELNADSSQDAQEPGTFINSYDVGQSNPVLAGVLLDSKSYAGIGTAATLLQQTTTTYQACPVAQVPPNTTPAISFACEKSVTTVLVERDPQNAVTTRIDRDYDGYGNVIKESNQGVINLGTPSSAKACDACAASGLFGKACGAGCTGDEFFTVTDYVVPGTDTNGAWITTAVKHQATGAVDGALDLETFTFYDGPDYVGLPSGQLTKGMPTRVARRTGNSSTDTVDVDRYKFDSNGNVVEHLYANSDVNDSSKGRRVYSYDSTGLHLATAEIRLSGASGDVSAIRRDIQTESAFEKTSDLSNWYPVVAGSPAATPQFTRYRFDEHGRSIRTLSPGDTDATASAEFQYQYADPASKIITLQRSSATSGQDLVTVRCFDGRGRPFQTRTKISSGSYQVSGFVAYDARGTVVKRYQPYSSSNAECETTAPSGVLFTSYKYDPLGRQLAETEVDGSAKKTEYRPLLTRLLDEDDNDTQSSRANTPVIEQTDGLGRLVSITRDGAQAGGGQGVSSYQYDARGNLSVVIDPAGHVHSQTFDRLGLITHVSDPNSGDTSFEYDGNGNELKRTDANGNVWRRDYDSANRVVAEWDEKDASSKVSYRYDLLPGCTECTHGGGDIVEVTWPGKGSTDSDRFGYDPKGNLLYAERSIAGKSFVTRTKYDLADREISTIYPGGLTLDKTWDGDGRVVGIPGAVSKIEYDQRGDPSKITFANNAATSFQYDDRRELKHLTTATADSTPVLDLSFQRSPRGDLLSIGDGDRPGRVRHSEQISYDGWDRTAGIALDREGADPEQLTYAYNSADDITSITSSVAESPLNLGAYAFDPAHPDAVTQTGAGALSYDATGAMATRGNRTFHRDYKGRIVSVEKDGAQAASYVWMGRQQVIRETSEGTVWQLDDDFELRDGISVAYARLGEQRVARLESDALAATVLSDLAPADGSGTLTPKGDKVIDVGDAWLAQAASKGIVQLSGGPAPSDVKSLLRSSARRLLMEDVVFLHGDQVTSVVAATAADGSIRGEQSFYPTGLTREQKGYVDEYGFTGARLDEDTGMLHFEYRDLDPVTGRWDMPDPAFVELDEGSVRSLGEATGGYAYVANSFVNTWDADGRASFSSMKASVKKWNDNRKQKAADKKAAGKPRSYSKIRKGALAAAIASAILSLVSVAESYQAGKSTDEAAEDARDTSNPDSAAKAADATARAADQTRNANILAVSATAVGALGTALNARVEHGGKYGKGDTSQDGSSNASAQTNSNQGATTNSKAQSPSNNPGKLKTAWNKVFPSKKGASNNTAATPSLHRSSSFRQSITRVSF